MGIILNNGQAKILEDAVDWYYNSSEQVFEIAGDAGTGKSVLMFEILKALKLYPYQIMPMAYTGKAAIVMRLKGFTSARSIHSSLYEVATVSDNRVNEAFGIPYKRKEFRKREYIDPRVCLFFIDEAYMVPGYMKKDILSFGKKVIVCGDSNQLPPVGDEPAFLVNSNVHRLTELVRQAQSNPIVYLANRAKQGLPIHNGTYGSVYVGNDNEFTPQMISYADILICGTNKTREILNSYVRDIAGFSHSVTPIFGERIICRNNNWELEQDGVAISNGLDGYVASFPDPSKFDGSTFKINFKPELVDTIFYDLDVCYPYFIGTYDERQDMKAYNSSTGKYLRGEFFEFGYAITDWLAQGSEYSRGVYFEEYMRPQIQNQLNYTGITRFKESAIWLRKRNKYIYIPTKENNIQL